MDSLISRRKTIEYLMTNMGWTDEDGYAVDDADEKRAHIEDLINGVPSAPAVPLDKLCEWLSENSINIPCTSCKNFVNEYCTAIGDKSRPCPNSADDWRRAITEWMEEQDAAD